MHKDFDVIIVGAGTAGLFAAHELLKKNYSICILEASSVPGGRIATIQEKGVENPVETGAEFIHGKLPHTLKLLKEAGIEQQTLQGRFIGVKDGEWNKREQHDDHWDELLKQMKKLKEDLPIEAFLEKYFGDAQYKDLREAVRRFAEGFDLADTTHASVFGIRDEWSKEEQTQYRVKGGYSQLIDWLLSRCLLLQASVNFDTCVKKIVYERDAVLIITK